MFKKMFFVFLLSYIKHVLMFFFIFSHRRLTAMPTRR